MDPIMDLFASELQAPLEDTPPTILLVDDDPGILEGVEDLLKLSHYHVLTATDGRAALEVMQSCVPDLIVSDIMMPDMDGYQFYEAVRSNPQWTTIPFIFLTARGQQSDIQRGNRLGADYYIVKPFEPEDLLAAIGGRLKRVRDIESVVRTDVERMKQQLITIFSHELRTPLTYIYGYVSLLQEQMPNFEPDSTQMMLNGIRAGAERLVRLVEDLMLIVRIDSGVVEMEITLRRERRPLLDIVEQVVADLMQEANKNRVTLSVDVPSSLEVFCVEAYLHDAIRRLVHNGIKFSKRNEGGTVRISARHEEGQVLIIVEDDGIGIDPAHQQDIFERFEQPNRPQLEQQGIGLGLSICRDLVTLHGGTITVESEPGSGSRFTVALPGITSMVGKEEAR
ncbi:MAG: response regulator [Anaerolineae bacterium]